MHLKQKSRPHKKRSAFVLEAVDGFEPSLAALQAAALPLGYTATHLQTYHLSFVRQKTNTRVVFINKALLFAKRVMIRRKAGDLSFDNTYIGYSDGSNRVFFTSADNETRAIKPHMPPFFFLADTNEAETYPYIPFAVYPASVDGLSWVLIGKDGNTK